MTESFWTVATHQLIDAAYRPPIRAALRVADARRRLASLDAPESCDADDGREHPSYDHHPQRGARTQGGGYSLSDNVSEGWAIN